MSSSTCLRCGLATASLLPSGLCATCHGHDDETRNATAHPGAPTATFLPPSAAADTFSRTADGDPFGVLPEAGYRYAEELGRGGMGCVYKAVRLATEQTVAVKRLRPEVASPAVLARFVREARILAGLDHPNIVRLFDFVPDPRDPHLVMEFVDGDPLSRHLTDGKVLAPDHVATLMIDAARGVHAAHEAGIIHRDLKPGNLLVTRDGRVKVSDFGLGKRLDADDGVSMTGQLVGGTPGFMAPEQVDDTAPECDRRADVWGLGACLYAAVAGKAPFPTGTRNATRVLSDPLVPPRAVNPAVPPVLDAIICRCLERDRARRYQSAAAVADDLDRYLRRQSTEAKPLPWPVRVWNRVLAIPRATAAAWGMAAVAGGVTLAVVLTPRPPATSPPVVDELALLQEQFLADQLVTLVPEKGLPKWSEWVLGGGQFVKSPNADDTAGLTTFGLGAVTLFTPPVGANSYTTDFEIRHTSGNLRQDPMGTWVGCFIGHERVTGANDQQVDSMLLIHFADLDLAAAQLKPPMSQAVGVSHTCYHRKRAGAARDERDHPLNADALRFTAKPNWPGEWRHVRVEVTPDRVRVLWAEGGQEKLVLERTSVQLDAHLENTRNAVAADRRLGVVDQDPTLYPTRWKPDGGFGLVCSSSGLTARNVTVRRTGPSP